MVQRNRSGFTLIELIVVVVVIGILAAIAIPRYQGLADRAREAEIEPLLRQVLTLEERYLAREGAYTMDLQQLEGGSTLPESGEFYSFSLVAHPTGLCIVASPNVAGQAAGLDPRSLDADRTFHESDDCS